MIPKADIIQWRKFAPWKSDAQVEQDLILGRALIEIFSNQLLSGSLLFRGGTALNKLFLHTPVRYSEDIDLVQKEAIPIGELMGEMRKTLNSWLGKPKTKQKTNSVVFIYRADSEIPPVSKLRIKIEINTREHFNIFETTQKVHSINSRWFSGECEITSYLFEELLATKLKALYQRSKGRDLFDLWYALKGGNIDGSKIISAFRKYVEADKANIPKEVFKNNVLKKLEDPDFLNDTVPILRPGIKYSPFEAYEFVREQLIEKL
jgi:predicted nucleotidyltransferase component of viral defense system